MAQFQYVWHNTWANVLLKFKTNKTFKYIFESKPQKTYYFVKTESYFFKYKKKSAIEYLLIAYIKNWSKYTRLKQ